MNAANAVSHEVAEKEVNKWLDFRRVRKKKREENESSIKDMIEAFEEGILSLDEKTNVIKQALIFETAGKKVFSFKPTMTVGEGQRRLKGIKAGEHQLMLSAYVAELTGEASEIIRQMNTEDYGISRTIAGFFF